MIDVHISKKVFNDKILPILTDDHRYIVSYGGSGSGKSYGFVECFIYFLLTKKQFNLLAVRQVANTNRDSTFALFKQIIHKWNMEKLFTINESEMRVKCINGNAVGFAGLDDVEKLKSYTFEKGELTDVWLEEASEMLESDFNQIDLRLRGGNVIHHIYISFNPILITHWLKKRFIDRKDDNITVIHSTYLDNKFIDDAYRRLLESYKETDPYHYQVYCLGQWGSVHESVFDTAKVQARIDQLEKPIKVGYFDYDKDMRFKWIDDPQGYIKLYELPNPNSKYCIGGDTASGVASDFCVGDVVDAKTGKQVAVLHNRFDTDLYAKQMYCLGHYYNYALIAIEVNFDLYPIRWLEEHGYTHQYVREQQDTFTGGIKKAFGFRTDSFTRPRIITQLIEIVREHVEIFNDFETLNEMFTFVRNDKGRVEAEENSHDDLVMASCIALECSKQVLFTEHTVKEQYNDYDSFFDFEG